MNLPRVLFTAAGHPIEAYVARTDEERALGLMHRREMADNEGMLFLCAECAIQHFWMKDTPLPLSAAFIDEDGTILQVEDLEPHSLDGVASHAPVRYVLEVHQGWFAERGIGPGVRLEGPLFAGRAVDA